MTERKTSTPPAVKATGLKMDAITDVVGMLVIAAFVLFKDLDVYHGAGMIMTIIGLMKFEAVRKKGGAIAAAVAPLLWLAKKTTLL